MRNRLRLVTTVPLTSSQPYRETVDVQVDAMVHEVDAVLAASNAVDVVVSTTRAALTHAALTAGTPKARHRQVPVSAHLAGNNYADIPQHNSYTPNYAMMAQLRDDRVFNNASPSSGLGPSSDDGSVVVHENTDDLELHAPSDRIEMFHTPRKSLAGVEKAADRAKIEAMAADLVAAQHERAALLESKTQADAELAAMLSKYEAIK